ncbi:MAG TPA: metalloregulator ArsR/SmtB family transcription factor [Candidatus Methylomirabilis sp.]|nr:metalloregulator ArsR/SmtB family transcription factor [Candidatus Methylomirabilis sp.]
MVMKAVVRLLDALADATRLRLVRLLLRQELCVCELVDALRMPQYKVSRHLRTLRAAGLVEARRDGRWMHYRLGRTAADGQSVRRVLDDLSREIARFPGVAKDDARLAERLRLRRAGQCVIGTNGQGAPGGKARAAAAPSAHRAATRSRKSRAGNLPVTR